jgi:hypothetical protein
VHPQEILSAARPLEFENVMQGVHTSEMIIDFVVSQIQVLDPGVKV